MMKKTNVNKTYLEDSSEKKETSSSQINQEKSSVDSIKEFESHISLAVQEELQKIQSNKKENEINLSAAKKSFSKEEETSSSSRQSSSSESFQPANDDQKLKTYSPDSSRFKPRILGLWALLLSVGWLVGLHLSLPNGLPILSFLKTGNINQFFLDQHAFFLTILTFLPVIFLWFFATAMYRLEEMGAASRKILDTAVRLSCPEQDIQERILGVSEAVRKEVGTLDSFIAKALNRAGDLKNLVQKEVSQLEKSSEESAKRVEKIIENLKSERQDIIEHATNVRTSVVQAQNGLKEEIGRATIFLKSEFEKHLQDIENLFFSRGQSLIGEFEVKADAIDKARESIVENINLFLEERVNGISESLKIQLNELMQAFNNGKENLAQFIELNGKQINETAYKTIAFASSTFEEHMGAFTRDLEKKKEQLAESIEKDLTNLIYVRQSLSSSVSEETKALVEERIRFAQILKEEIQELSSERIDFSNNLQSYIMNINEARSATSQAIQSDLHEIKETRSAFDEMLTSCVSKIFEGQNHISETFKNNFTLLETQKETFSSFISDIFKSQIENLEVGKKSFAQSLETDLTKLMHIRSGLDKIVADQIKKLSDSGEYLSHALHDDLDKLNQIREKIDQQIENHKNAFSEARSEISMILDQDVEKIKQAFENYDTSIQTSRDLLEKTLAQGVDSMAVSIETNAEKIMLGLQDKIEHSAEVLARQTDTLLSDADRRIAYSTKETSNALLGCVEEIRSDFDTVHKSLSQSAEQTLQLVDTSVQNANNLFLEKTEKLSQLLEGVQEKIACDSTQNLETILSRTNGISTIIVESAASALTLLDEANKKITLSSKESLDTVDLHAQKITELFEEKDKKLAEKTIENANILTSKAIEITKSFDEAEKSLSQRVSETSFALGKHVSDMKDIVENIYRDFSSRAEESCRDVESKRYQVFETFEKIDSSFAEKTKDFSNTLEEKAVILSHILEQSNSKLVERFEEASLNFEKKGHDFYEIVCTAEKNLSNSLIKSSESLVKILYDAQKNLLTLSEQTSDSVLNKLQKSNIHITEQAGAITEAMTLITQHVNQVANQARDVIQENTRHFSDLLDTRSNEISSLFSSNSLALVERFVSQGDEIQRNITQATEDVTKQLRDENSRLLESIAKQTDDTVLSVGGIRTLLGKSISELVEKIDISKTQLFNLVKETEETFENVDERLNKTALTFSGSLDQAVEAFENSTQFLDQKALQLKTMSSESFDRIEGIAVRFDEYSNLLSNANDILGSAQNNFALTMENSQTSLENLLIGLVKKSEDIQRVMTSFESLIENTLHNAEEQTKSSANTIHYSVSNLVESATKRFSEATEMMRNNVLAVRSELEDAASILKKGISEMPFEAQESTNFIRHSITEQINALKELASIAAQYQHSSHSDLSGATPSLKQTSSPVYRSEERGVKMPSSSLSELRRSSDALTAQIQKDMINSMPPTSFSLAEEDKETAKSVEDKSMFPSLSNIKHMIDLDALAAFWTDIELGKNSLPLDCVFTQQGKESLLEIRSRCISDPEFQKTIERYCLDFERLISGIARTERGKAMLKAYRMSDKGQAYMILAHAVGRI